MVWFLEEETEIRIDGTPFCRPSCFCWISQNGNVFSCVLIVCLCEPANAYLVCNQEKSMAIILERSLRKHSYKTYQSCTITKASDFH